MWWSKIKNRRIIWIKCENFIVFIGKPISENGSRIGRQTIYIMNIINLFKYTIILQQRVVAGQLVFLVK